MASAAEAAPVVVQAVQPIAVKQAAAEAAVPAVQVPPKR